MRHRRSVTVITASRFSSDRWAYSDRRCDTAKPAAHLRGYPRLRAINGCSIPPSAHRTALIQYTYRLCSPPSPSPLARIGSVSFDSPIFRIQPTTKRRGKSTVYSALSGTAYGQYPSHAMRDPYARRICHRMLTQCKGLCTMRSYAVRDSALTC